MNDRAITIRIRDVYGVPTNYPVDENAARFAEIAGKRTLSARDLDNIRKLGFEVKVEARVPT